MDKPYVPESGWDWRALVNTSDHTISREIFVDPDIYRLELDRVFTHAWLFVGHESLIPDNGDYVLSRMGDESVILTRDNKGKVHVFLNSCTHRGMKVCRYDEGNTAEFTCPFHGWAFTLDGRLAGVPKFQTGYGGRLDRDAWGLVEVAQLALYRGTVWAAWDPDLPPFETHMGGMLGHLDEFLDPPDGDPDGELEVIGGLQKWVMPCNWKFGAENFAGDNYHNHSHVSLHGLNLSPSGRKGRHQFDALPKFELKNISFPEPGHSARGMLLPADAPYVPLYGSAEAEVENYFRDAHAARQKRLGERARFAGHGGTVFPNMSFSNGRMSIAVWHPLGPERTEAWRFYLVPKNAPRVVKDTLRHYAISYQGPGGLTEQDDMENWERAAAASRGTIARRHPYNFQLCLHDVGHEAPIAGMPQPGGRVSPDVSEENQRGFYGHWARLMAAPE